MMGGKVSKVKLNAKQIKELKDEAQELVSRCDNQKKLPKGRGFWDTVFNSLDLLPGVIALIMKLIDMLDGDDDA
jgi:hypothetical protein